MYLRRLGLGLLAVASVVGCGLATGEEGGGDTGSVSGAGGFSPGTVRPSCPLVEPEQGVACGSHPFTCPYAACGRMNGSLWSCEGGNWNQVFIPGCNTAPDTCPPRLPEALSQCDGPHLTCEYMRPCCDRNVAVHATCSSGRWHLLDENPDACPACSGAEQGRSCDLPKGCFKLTCYQSGCNGRPKISRCTSGTWQTEQLCE